MHIFNYKNQISQSEGIWWIIITFVVERIQNTIPLISKVYFKDSTSVPAHGFDAVHVSEKEKILWLGESKLYDDSKKGIKALVQDLNEHINTDYLNDQFLIIEKNLDNNSIPNRDKWIDTIRSCKKLGDKLNIINIPMLCTYTDDIYENLMIWMIQSDAISWSWY